ncbi:MAG: beta-ketoacyl synthase N-terminal-like domain-containing protein, partial [Planctomycetota bacterium]
TKTLEQDTDAQRAATDLNRHTQALAEKQAAGKPPEDTPRHQPFTNASTPLTLTPPDRFSNGEARRDIPSTIPCRPSMPRPATAQLPAAAPRLAITGLGLITPLGDAAWPTFRALLAGKTLEARAAACPAEADPFTLAQATGAVAGTAFASVDPAVDLAEHAAREAADQAGIPLAHLPLYLGTSKGALQTLSTHLGDPRYAKRSPAEPSPQIAQRFPPHANLERHLQRRLNLIPNRHTVAACASSLVALHQARMDLLDPRRDEHQPAHALVLTVDAALSPALLHSYRRLGVLAPLTPDQYHPRPLSTDPPGFVLAQTAAAVVLSRLPADAQAPPTPGTLSLDHTAIANDTHHLIHPAPSLPALRHLAAQILDQQQTQPEPPITLLHPHAPGTPYHDAAELQALSETFRPQPEDGPKLPVYAAKGAIGHALGASPLAALVLAALMLKSGKRPPMPWLDRYAPRLTPGLDLCSAPLSTPRRGSHAVFAAGFAGHNAAARISHHV